MIGVNFVPGTLSSALCAGIKSKSGKPDIALISFPALSHFAAVTTLSTACAPGVEWTRMVARKGKIKAILINSGNANAGTFDAEKDMHSVLDFTAQKLNTSKKHLVFHSTGIIGKHLPVSLINEAIPKLISDLNVQGEPVAQAILTTDLVIKTVEKKVESLGIHIGAVAKGSGMIHPQMATMLVYIVTDAFIKPHTLRKALKNAVDQSFNQLSVDMDTSTSDAVLLVATGQNPAAEIRDRSPQFQLFQSALTEICIELAKKIARDGEGATKLIEVRLTGARSLKDARKFARQVICSPLLKCAIHAGDNNWGRVVAALGSTRIRMDVKKLKVEMKGLQTPDVQILIDLGLGKYQAEAYGCDFSKEYIDINSHYN